MGNDNFDQDGINGMGNESNGYRVSTPPKSNAGKYIGIGCLSIVVIFIALGYIAYQKLIGVMEGAVIEYTETEPRELPKPLVSASESESTLYMFDQFVSAVKNDEAAKPLVLSADQINQVISYHPDFEPFSDKVYARINDNLLSAEVSFPLDGLKEMSEMLIGRYLNGSIELDIELKSGRLEVYVESVEVKGEQVPEEYMQKIRTENWAQDLNDKKENKDFAEVIEKLETITIKNGIVEIVPKKQGI